MGERLSQLVLEFITQPIYVLARGVKALCSHHILIRCDTMAAWDPFSDPADEGVPVTLKGGDIIKVDDGDAPGQHLCVGNVSEGEAQKAKTESWKDLPQKRPASSLVP